jgi:hypothetical protein
VWSGRFPPVQSLTHPPSQLLGGERLGQKGQAEGEDSDFGERGGAVARDVQDSRLRTVTGDLCRQIVAAHPGKDHVGQEQIDATDKDFAQHQGLVRASGLQNLVAAVSQDFANDQANLDIVFDKQNDFGTTSRTLGAQVVFSAALTSTGRALRSGLFRAAFLAPPADQWAACPSAGDAARPRASLGSRKAALAK